MDILAQNKAAVIRFNKEVIEQGNLKAFYELMHSEFIKPYCFTRNQQKRRWHDSHV